MRSASASSAVPSVREPAILRRARALPPTASAQRGSGARNPSSAARASARACAIAFLPGGSAGSDRAASPRLARRTGEGAHDTRRALEPRGRDPSEPLDLLAEAELDALLPYGQNLARDRRDEQAHRVRADVDDADAVTGMPHRARRTS